MVRGRTTAPAGLVLGHEITGEVIECGSDVLYVKKGDIVSVPFNVACGRCTTCKAGLTGICLNVNPARPGGAYGYVDMGGWIGGQAEYVMVCGWVRRRGGAVCRGRGERVREIRGSAPNSTHPTPRHTQVPYADFNLLKLGRDSAQAMDKIRDLALLSDIFPTGYHGCVTAGVGPGSTVYIAGGGPVGLAAAVSAQLLGAACVIVGDLIPGRLEQARAMGCETVDVSKDTPVQDQVRGGGVGGAPWGADPLRPYAPPPTHPPTHPPRRSRPSSARPRWTAAWTPSALRRAAAARAAPARSSPRRCSTS